MSMPLHAVVLVRAVPGMLRNRTKFPAKNALATLPGDAWQSGPQRAARGKRHLWTYASGTLIEITLQHMIFAGDADFVIFARFIALANC
ncbi:hypothetical protein XCY_003705 [Xanthomonas euroxanthea]|uniref:hypothetical protein n=1 Tax=Xanthomonas TaxID=338 RepID=UPI000F8DB8C1|nr:MULTISPECIES: hypothetical protein [Xanthomonas]CAG2096457.1 hypothetical protein XCY_003705 [Xanthomonas euroxanthea]